MTLIYQVLGKGRIREICEQYGLSSADAKITDELLVRWEKLVGNSSAKIQVALELTSNNTNRGKIMEATFAICVEFAEKQLAKETLARESN
jgi:hypothetical protein